METLALKVEVGNQLRVFMAKRGFRSIQALASETGISPGTLYGLDKAKHTNISLENVCKLLWVLDCHFEDLFEFTIESNEPNDMESLSDEVLDAFTETQAEREAFMAPAKSKHPVKQPLKTNSKRSKVA